MKARISLLRHTIIAALGGLWFEFGNPRLCIFSAIGLASLTALAVAEDRPQPITKTRAMVYKPAHGAIWDPSVLWHNGKYYMFSMYWPEGVDHWASIWLATSADGVHWNDGGEVIPRARAQSRNKTVYKCCVARCGDRFVMNFGAFSGRPGTDQDTLCFYQSQDLIHWKYVEESHPDPRWYIEAAPAGRWDAMYMLPKEEGNPKAGYWGWVVANPKPAERAQNRAFGMMESADGLHWKAIQPPLADWSGMDRIIPSLAYETGGVERIDGKYYLIAGTIRYLGQISYSMFTFVSDSPTGPFKFDPKAWRLCGALGEHPPRITGEGVSQLAAWVRGNGELLISNYVTYENVALLPLRKPLVDADGHLHLGYWKANDAAKGSAVTLDAGWCEQIFPQQPHSLATDGQSVCLKTDGLVGREATSPSCTVAVLPQFLDLKQGVILEGIFRASVGRPRASYAGFYLEGKGDKNTGILLEVGNINSRRSHIGDLQLRPRWEFRSYDQTGPGCATVTGLDPNRKHTFRLWIFHNLVELYIDDMLMQTMAVHELTGRVGFLIQNGEVTVSDLKAWRMNL